MSFDGNMNSVHTLFLIFNTLSPFVFGVFLFAFGVGRGVLAGMTGGLGGCAAVGAALAGLAALGYWGALRHNTKMLCIYAWATAGCAGFEVVHLAMLGATAGPPGSRGDMGLQAFYVTMICVIATSIVSLSLAGILAVRLRAAAAAASAGAGWTR